MARISQNPLPHGEYHGVVIVGAGLAGLSVARQLLENDVQALVLEQEGIIGGRCMTLPFGKGVFDLGAQYYTVRHPEFKTISDFWLRQGCAKEWTRGFPEISGVAELASHPRYCGIGGMRTLAEALAQGVLLRTHTMVKRIVEGRACWLVEVDGSKRIKADIVVLTLPLPAALRIISDENTWRMGALLLPLTGVEYAPHIAAAALLDGPSGLPQPGAARVEDPIISWLADNQQKGISPKQAAVTLHATRAFARAHSDTPLAEVTPLLIQAAAPHLKSAITDCQCHRWLHGAPVNTLPKSYYLVEGRAPLYFTGDAFCGGLVEGAVLSGLNAGRAIAERLKLARP